MIVHTRKIFIAFFFVFIKISSQHLAAPEIEKLIKEDNWEEVHFKLMNSNLKFKHFSVPDSKPEYLLLFRLHDATHLYREGKYYEAEKSLLSTLKRIEKSKNKLDLYHYESLKHIAITRLFYTEKRLGNISKGLKYLNIYGNELSPPYRKKQIIFFAVAYGELGNYKKAIEILNKRLLYYQSNDSHIYNKYSKELETAATYNTKGEIFIKWYKDTGEKKFLDSAYNDYKMAFQAIKGVSNFTEYSRGLHNLRMANIALLKKQYAYSLSLFNNSEKDSVLMSKVFSREDVWLGKAEVYTYLKNTDSAFFYINKLYKNDGKAQSTYDHRLKIYHLLSINYENTGESKKAYEFAKLSLSEVEKAKTQHISGINFLGLYEKQEIKTLSEGMIAKSRKSFLSLGFLLLFLLLIIIFKVYRRKKEIILNQQNEIFRSEEIFAAEKNTVPPIIEKELIDKILLQLNQLEVEQKFLSNDFKLNIIAKGLQTNTAYLSQIINEYKKASFSDYVHDLRIDYVTKKLQTSPFFRRYTIHAISKEIGYKSPTTFVKAFKDRIHITPSDYIRQLENENF